MIGNRRRRYPMIDIPIGKALVPVEKKGYMFCSSDCLFSQFDNYDQVSPCRFLECDEDNRKDGKNVIFKLVSITNEIDDFFVVPHGYRSNVDEILSEIKEKQRKIADAVGIMDALIEMFTGQGEPEVLCDLHMAKSLIEEATGSKLVDYPAKGENK
jgi:hypothetical protein